MRLGSGIEEGRELVVEIRALHRALEDLHGFDALGDLSELRAALVQAAEVLLAVQIRLVELFEDLCDGLRPRGLGIHRTGLNAVRIPSPTPLNPTPTNPPTSSGSPSRGCPG